MEVARARRGITAVLMVLGVTSLSAAVQAASGGTSFAPAEATVLMRQGLTNPALKLTEAQKARILGVVKSYVAEDKAIDQRYPAKASRERIEVAQGKKLTPERLALSADQAKAASEKRQAHEKMAVAIDQVLSESQRQTLKSTQDARPEARMPAATSSARQH